MKKFMTGIFVIACSLILTACAVGNGNSGSAKSSTSTTSSSEAPTPSYGAPSDAPPSYIYRAPSARTYNAISSNPGAVGAIRAGGGRR